MSNRAGIGRQDRRQGSDPATLQRHFGTTDELLPLWIAEPDLGLVPEVVEALRQRADDGWYGYELRPESVIDAFWQWMTHRHRWDGSALRTVVSPSVGTSIGVMIDALTEPGDGVIIQPPVFTDFKPTITANERQPIRNPLLLTDEGYRLDLDHLASVASQPRNRMLVLCNPHNPVGRVWTLDELDSVAAICAEHDVFVLADEIHADLVLGSKVFVPFATAAADHDVAWAATHGPIKTFGLAGVCDSLLITDRDHVADRFEHRSRQFHLNRNNVFGLTAFETAYRTGAPWLDGVLQVLDANVELLRERLPAEVGLTSPEGTFLAWLDLRGLGLEVDEIPGWLASAGVALSPGHWFGREGAGFARMTIAVPTATIELAAAGLAAAARGEACRSR